MKSVSPPTEKYLPDGENFKLWAYVSDLPKFLIDGLITSPSLNSPWFNFKLNVYISPLLTSTTFPLENLTSGISFPIFITTVASSKPIATKFEEANAYICQTLFKP